MRKTLMTIAATAVIASSFGIASTAEAATNNSQGTNSLQDSYPRVESTKLVSNSSNSSITINSVDTYKVKSGDTLWGISSQLGVSVDNIQSWNNLSSNTIQVDQVLKVKLDEKHKKAPEPVQLALEVDSDNSSIVNEATKLVGTRYVFGGTTPSGFDCSGYIYYVFNKAGKSISRTSSAGYYNQTVKVDTPQVGDLAFFANTYKDGISHTGIYVGNNSFAHASSSGVKITNLNDSYWSKYFHSIRRLK